MYTARVLMFALITAANVSGRSQQDGSSVVSAARQAVVVQVKSKIALDGALDEPDWAAASSIGEILQREPKQGEAATERTEVKLLYDADNFYVGVSPYLTFFNLVQFDNRSKNLGWQSRVRWIVRPGNEVFIVFNQGWIQDDSGGYRFRAADRNIASKVQDNFRF